MARVFGARGVAPGTAIRYAYDMARARRLWPILFFLALPLVPLWRAVLFGEAIGPFDQVRQMAPWNESKPAQPWDVLQVDGVLQFYPWRQMVFEAWSNGQLPLWNPYALTGTPLLANSQSAGFYPPHILLGLSHLPTGTAMLLLAWMHLAWAGLGVYMLTRVLGGTRPGSAFAGASFALSAFMLSWTALPSVISTCAWIPWLLWGVERLMAGGRCRAALGTALALGMMLLAGHLQFAAYGLIGAALWAGVRLLTAPLSSQARLAGLGWGLLAAIWGVALAAPQIFPALAFSEQSHRRADPTDEGYRAYLRGALQPYELATLPQATLLGNPRDWAKGSERSVSAYWPPLVKTGANFAESAIALGPLALTLLFLAPWKRRALWPLAAVGLGALAIALGTPLNALLYYQVPGWSASGSPARIGALFVLAACVAAGLGVREGMLGKRAYALGIPILLGLLALPLAISARGPERIAPEIFSALQMGALISALGPLLLAAGISIGALALFRRGGMPARSVWLIAPVVIAILGSSHRLVPTGKPPETLKAPGFERVAVVNEPWEILAAAPALLPPNLGALSKIHELGGYDSLIDRDTVEMLRSVQDQDPAPPANGNMMFVKPSVRADLLPLTGSTLLWAREPIPGYGVPERHEGMWMHRVPGLGRVFTAYGKGRVLEEGYDRLVVEGVGPGVMVVRDRMMPGWSARLVESGEILPMWPGLWREVQLPPGRHTVEFRYNPPGLRLGLLCGLPAWALGLALALRFRRRSPGSSVERDSV